MNNKRESDIEDEMWDQVYHEIEKDITISKNNNDTLNIQKHSGNFCKICGDPLPYFQIQRKCPHCRLSICSDCRSNFMCIYCFINLRKPIQIALKLSKLLFFFTPFLVFFSTFLFLNLRQIIQILMILMGIFGSFYVLLQFCIYLFPHKFFVKKWETFISSPQFKAFRLDKRRLKFASQELIKDFSENKRRRIEKLNNWVNFMFSQYNAPVPSYLHDENEKIEKKILETAKNEAISENQVIFAVETKASSLMKNENTRKLPLCPKCSNKLLFGTLCVSCNIKICPKCLQENDPYSKHCICGYNFPDPIEQSKI